MQNNKNLCLDFKIFHKLVLKYLEFNKRFETLQE